MHTLPLLWAALALPMWPMVAEAKPIAFDLEASWNQAPFAWEVVEAIAAANASAYYPLLSQYAALREETTLVTDQDVYDQLTTYAQAQGFISGVQRQMVQVSVAYRRQAALIQAYFQYFDTMVAPQLPDGADCVNVLSFNGKLRCDVDAVFALETVSETQSEPLLATDHVFGNSEWITHLQGLDAEAAAVKFAETPLAILYADLESEQFGAFHWHLLDSALSSKIRYVVRPKPPADFTDRSKLNLAGYAIELGLKRTDYLVIDDRNKADIGSRSDAKDKSEVKVSTNAYGTVNQSSLGSLGLKAAAHILDAEDPLEALQQVTSEFPLHAADIAARKGKKKLREQVEANTKPGSGVLGTGENRLLVNGANIFDASSTGDNVFGLLDAIDQELGHIRDISALLGSQIDDVVVSELIAKNLVAKASEENQVTRYDYRTPGLVWINDIEIEDRYKQFPADLAEVLNADVALNLFPVRRNANSIVFALDLGTPGTLEVLLQTLSLFTKVLPVQFGLIPLGHTELGKLIAEHLFDLSVDKSNTDPVQAYFMLMSNGQAPNDAYRLAKENYSGKKGPDQKPLVLSQDSMTELQTSIADWAQKFDLLSPESSLILVNGRAIAQNANIITSMQSALVEDVFDIQAAARAMLEKRTDATTIRDALIEGSATERSLVVHPADPNTIVYVSTGEFHEALGSDIMAELPQFTFSHGGIPSTYWAFGDFAQKPQVLNLRSLFQALANAEVNARVIVVPTEPADSAAAVKDEFLRSKMSGALLQISRDATDPAELLHELDELISRAYARSGSKGSLDYLRSIVGSAVTEKLKGSALEYLLNKQHFVINGRLVALPSSLSKALTASNFEQLFESEKTRYAEIAKEVAALGLEISDYKFVDTLASRYAKTFYRGSPEQFFQSRGVSRVSVEDWVVDQTSFQVLSEDTALLQITAVINPLSSVGQRYASYIKVLSGLDACDITVVLNPEPKVETLPLKNFFKGAFPQRPSFDESGARAKDIVRFEDLDQDTLFTTAVHAPQAWIVNPVRSVYDLDNIVLSQVREDELRATYELKALLLEGHAMDMTTRSAPSGMQLELGPLNSESVSDTIVMANLAYLQFQVLPGLWEIKVAEGRSSEIFSLDKLGSGQDANGGAWVTEMTGLTILPTFSRKRGQEEANVLQDSDSLLTKGWNLLFNNNNKPKTEHADVNIFSVASGHLYERFLGIMTKSVMTHSNHTVKFWFIEDFLSPAFKEFLPFLAEKYGFQFELVTYRWPHWLRMQTEKQRTIWGYKILFLDVLFPQSLEKVIFVDADQIVRTDLKELVDMDLEGAPYGFTPMCNDRPEIEGFRFWNQGFWEKFLGDEYRYHISALYVVDLQRFRSLAAGDRLRQHYQRLSADPESLANLDQDLPNHLQKQLPIFSLPQEWLWCETWCSDESLAVARTIDLCNNPMTKEPKLDRARRQIPEWVGYDEEVAALEAEFRASLRKEKAEKAEQEVKVEQEVKAEQEVAADEEAEEASLHEEL